MRSESNYSPETNEVLKQSGFNALVTRYEFIHTPHLLLGLLDVSRSVRDSLNFFTGDRHSDLKVRRAVHTLIEPGSGKLPLRDECSNLPPHPNVQRIFERAENERAYFFSSRLEPLHILTGLVANGLITEGDVAFRALGMHKYASEKFIQYIRSEALRGRLSAEENTSISIFDLEQC